MLSTLGGLLLGIALTVVAFRLKEVLQDRIFFERYRTSDHSPMGELKAPLLLGIAALNPDRRERSRTFVLHQPLRDPDLDRRRYFAWLLEGGWVLAALLCFVVGVTIGSWLFK
jgi:hypothetical protein